VKVSLEQGPDKGSIDDLGELGRMSAEDLFAPELEPGDRIVVGCEPANDVYFYSDRQRRGTLLLPSRSYDLGGQHRSRGRGARDDLAGVVGRRPITRSRCRNCR